MCNLDQVVADVTRRDRCAVDLALAFVLCKLHLCRDGLRGSAQKFLGGVVRPKWGEFEAAVDLLPVGRCRVQVSRQAVNLVLDVFLSLYSFPSVWSSGQPSRSHSTNW